MDKLYLLYQSKYTAPLQINKKIILTGDESFVGDAILKKEEEEENIYSLQLTLKCHPKLMSYTQKQFIFINCLIFTKFPKITKKFIGRDCIELPKRQCKISWMKKDIKEEKEEEPLERFSKIYFRIRVAVKPNDSKENIKFIPTFKEIAKEISKLSDEKIEQERREYNEWLKNGCPYLVFETLQQKTTDILIEQKKRNYKINLSSKQFKKHNQIKQKLLIQNKKKKNNTNTNTKKL